MRITKFEVFTNSVLLSIINPGESFVFTREAAVEYGSAVGDPDISSQTIFMRTKSSGAGMGNFGFMNIANGEQFSTGRADIYRVYLVQSFQAQSC